MRKVLLRYSNIIPHLVWMATYTSLWGVSLLIGSCYVPGTQSLHRLPAHLERVLSRWFSLLTFFFVCLFYHIEKRCVSVCVWSHTNASVYTERSDRNLWERILSFYLLGIRGWTHPRRLGSKYLYLQRHSGPSVYVRVWLYVCACIHVHVCRWAWWVRSEFWVSSSIEIHLIFLSWGLLLNPELIGSARSAGKTILCLFLSSSSQC